MIQQITIKAVEQAQTKTGNTKITLKDDTHKYSFYKNKKDGSQSRAYEQWKTLQDSPVVVAEVKSEEQSFVNAQGKNITYMSNMIMYFDTKNAPQSVQEPQTAQMPIQTQTTPQIANSSLQDDTISKIRIAFKGMQEKLQYLEAENAILRDRVEKLENVSNGFYQALVFGKCEDAFEMGKIKLMEPEVDPNATDDEEMVNIADVPY